MLTPATCRAGRALLDWSQEDLAKHSRLGSSTIRNFEAGRTLPTSNNLSAIERALEEGGVLFIEMDGTHGAGVRLRQVDWEHIASLLKNELVWAYMEAVECITMGSAASMAVAAIPKLAKLLETERPTDAASYVRYAVTNGLL